MGIMNADTNRAVMQRYFEKLGEVAMCYHVMKKGSNKYEGYGFVIFKAAAKVQRARPHTIQGKAVRTRRDLPDKVTKKKKEKLHFSRVQEFQNRLKKYTSNFHLEDHFGKYGTVISVSRVYQVR